MKGIILAGGTGTRLYPITKGVCKQLLPVYDKPLIYYPLTTLMLAGITDILLITTPHDQTAFNNLLGDGSQWGIHITYAVQANPEGIAQAFIIAEDFINNSPVCLILGDNIFYGQGLSHLLQRCATETIGATIFAYYVQDPERYGVITFDDAHRVLDIEEKPKLPRSHYAVTGLYFYDQQVVELAKQLRPSKRGELEITDLNRFYLQQNHLHVETLGRGTAWLDTGTFNSLLEAGHFIQVVESRQGLKIASPEEIAWRMHYIDAQQVKKIAQGCLNSGYGQYLLQILERE